MTSAILQKMLTAVEANGAANGYTERYDSDALHTLAVDAGANTVTRNRVYEAIRTAAFGSSDPGPLASWLKAASHAEVASVLEAAMHASEGF